MARPRREKATIGTPSTAGSREDDQVSIAHTNRSGYSHRSGHSHRSFNRRNNGISRQLSRQFRRRKSRRSLASLSTGTTPSIISTTQPPPPPTSEESGFVASLWETMNDIIQIMADANDNLPLPPGGVSLADDESYQRFGHYTSHNRGDSRGSRGGRRGGLRRRSSSAGTGLLALEEDSDDDSFDYTAYSLEYEAMISRMLTVLRFAIFADAINSQVLGPNYALLVKEDDNPESFSSTAPFGFGAAYFFIPLTGDIGMVLSSLTFGYLSDKPWFGRKLSILACMYVGAIGSMMKYNLRENYWAFCAANFFSGVFGGSLAVGMAYVSDVVEDRKQTDAEIGIIIATSMIGRTGGGVLAILMKPIGLFAPLWVSAAISVLAGLLCHIYLIEPDITYESLDEEEEEEDFDAQNTDAQNALTTIAEENSNSQFKDFSEMRDNSFSMDFEAGVADDDNDTIENSRRIKYRDPDEASDSMDSRTVDSKVPTHLDHRALINVLAGELFDNLGSIGLVPFCLSPLMFQTWYGDFDDAGLDPIMSENAYQWIYVFIALIVIPGAAVAPALFQKFGPAMSAVGANLLTGAITVVLLQIANINPPTYATYCIFVTVLYLAFPMTVISQLSTGPMLDRISPLDQRGKVQGFNMAAMNFASAIGPFLYGVLHDTTNIDVTLYTTTGVSAIAAAVNYLMVGDKRFGPIAQDENSISDEDLLSDSDDDDTGRYLESSRGDEESKFPIQVVM